MPKSPKTPFDTVREAFAELDASEKTAFVLEATFAAVGEGLAETGRRFADAVGDIDTLFSQRAAHDEPAEAEPTASRKKAGTLPGATAKPKPKTAGKTKRKPDTDSDDA